jgi:hypothetical protein
MPKKENLGCLFTPVEIFRSIFGKDGWIVANWFKLKGQKEVEPEIDLKEDDSQTREGLKKFLDKFEEVFSRKKMSIDSSDFLEKICEWTGVVVKGEVPDLSDKIIMIGNYPGEGHEFDDEDPFLEPTVYGLIRLMLLAKEKNVKNVVAAARETTFYGMDERLEQATEKHIAFAKKDPEKGYEFCSGQGRKLKFLRFGNGIFWSSPAADTKYEGLPTDNLVTKAVRQAMKKKRLLILAIETNKAGTKAVSIEIKEIPLPTVQLNKGVKLGGDERKEILREINLQITRWALAETASCLPVEQRGQYPHPDFTQAEVALNLWRINLEGMFSISGGFMPK